MIFTLIAIIVVVFLVSLIASAGKSAGSSVLVLKEFWFNENDDQFLKIIGRPAGIIGLIKSSIGNASLTSFLCNKHEVKYESSGIKYNIPLRHVTCVSSGIKRPIILLIIGILSIIAGIVASLLGIPQLLIASIILGILLIILNIFNKNMQFNIFIGENRPIISIKLKGQNVDVEKVGSAYNALNKAVLEIK